MPLNKDIRQGAFEAFQASDAPSCRGAARPSLSVVIPTKNEAANIGACIHAFDAVRDRVEILVIDNVSTDETTKIASSLGARVIEQGPERCAQRNRGWREATAARVLFVDADMIVLRETIDEILSLNDRLALYVPETRVGHGLRLKARNFERSFYDGTCIDALRVIPRDVLNQVGGYDEALVACEDWDLDRRLKAAGIQTAITKGALLHNEARQDLKRLLAKKAYYARSIDRYRAKWGEDEVTRRQFGLFYRFLGVFIERGQWRHLLRHPILATVMYAERVLVGLVYLLYR